MRNGGFPPLLSIVIPVYNRQGLLNSLLNELQHSIVNNNLSDSIEIVVIDDFSSPLIDLSGFQYQYILKRNKVNCGAPVSRELGYQISHGKFIHFHDSDDSINEKWLESLVGSLIENTEIDVFLTGRDDKNKLDTIFRFQKYFHRHHDGVERISKRLVYRNCMGPLGGVTFSRRVLDKIRFKKFASCQDWQMYFDAIKHAKVLVSRPDIKFIFNKTRDDRISHNPTKKILGHLQLAKITGRKSLFGRNIRLFYLYTCKQHIYNKGGLILKFYKKNRLSIFVTFLVVSVYWRIT